MNSLSVLKKRQSVSGNGNYCKNVDWSVYFSRKAWLGSIYVEFRILTSFHKSDLNPPVKRKTFLQHDRTITILTLQKYFLVSPHILPVVNIAVGNI